jgi:hypothetical protein
MPGAHVVQLFDSDESLIEAVTAFLHEGFTCGEKLVAVMNERRWYAVAMRLSACGMPVDEACAAGALTVHDASDLLEQFMRNGRPDPALFENSVGALIRELSAGGARLRVYGEMVNVLAAEGEYRAALELEELWNDLGQRSEFRLYCGYSSAHFANPRDAEALRRICAAHSDVLSSQQDILGEFVLRLTQAADAV